MLLPGPLPTIEIFRGEAVTEGTVRDSAGRLYSLGTYVFCTKKEARQKLIKQCENAVHIARENLAGLERTYALAISGHIRIETH